MMLFVLQSAVVCRDCIYGTACLDCMISPSMTSCYSTTLFLFYSFVWFLAV
jgi:hypothetical protein